MHNSQNVLENSILLRTDLPAQSTPHPSLRQPFPDIYENSGGNEYVVEELVVEISRGI